MRWKFWKICSGRLQESNARICKRNDVKVHSRRAAGKRGRHHRRDGAKSIGRDQRSNVVWQFPKPVPCSSFERCPWRNSAQFFTSRGTFPIFVRKENSYFAQLYCLQFIGSLPRTGMPRLQAGTTRGGTLPGS